MLNDPFEGLELRSETATYTLIQRVGFGASAWVYQSTSTAHTSLVALKLYKPHEVGDRRLATEHRIRRELEIASTVHHRNVARSLDWGRSEIAGESHLFVVMEFAEGDTLAQIIHDQGPFAPRMFQIAANQLAEAVKALHDAGAIHCDIKPDNVIVRPDGSPVLVDFGLSRIIDATQVTTARTFLGTYAYAPPEAFTDPDAERKNPAADIYSLGATFYEMMMGSRLFADAVGLEQLIQHILSVPPVLSQSAYPTELLDLTRRMLAKRAEIRPTIDAVIECVSRQIVETMPIAPTSSIDAFFQGIRADSRIDQRLAGEADEREADRIFEGATKAFVSAVRAAAEAHRLIGEPRIQRHYPSFQRQLARELGLPARFPDRSWPRSFGIMITAEPEYKSACDIHYFVDGLPLQARLVRAIFSRGGEAFIVNDVRELSTTINTFPADAARDCIDSLDQLAICFQLANQ